MDFVIRDGLDLRADFMLAQRPAFTSDFCTDGQAIELNRNDLGEQKRLGLKDEIQLRQPIDQQLLQIITLRLDKMMNCRGRRTCRADDTEHADSRSLEQFLQRIRANPQANVGGVFEDFDVGF